MVRSAALTIIVPLDADGIERGRETLAALFEQLDRAGREARRRRRARGRPSSTCATAARSTRCPAGPVDGRRLTEPPATIAERFAAAYERNYGHAFEVGVDDRLGPGDRADGAAAVRPTGSGEDAATAPRPRPAAYSFASDEWLDSRSSTATRCARRRALAGPAIVLEKTTTTYLDAGMEGVVHESGALVVTTPTSDAPKETRNMSTQTAEPRERHASIRSPPSIIRHGLDAAADQMLVALKRTAFSPIIYEVMDGAGAFYDRQFRMLSQMSALPMFTGSLGLAVESVVNHYDGQRRDLRRATCSSSTIRSSPAPTSGTWR